jgi:OOP family OmpA-OmpF porin
LFGGYQVNRNLAVEFGYTDLGEAKASFSGFGNVSIGATGFEGLAVGILPFNAQWSALGKVGLFIWDVKAKDGTGLVGSESASGASLTWGVGVAWQFTPKAALRVEYQQYNDLGDENTTGQGDISVIGANVLYRF